MLGMLFSIATLIPSQVQAQSVTEPAVVISVANLDEQLKDIKYLLSAAGFPEFNFIAKAAIKGYAEGVDFSRNGGLALYFGGDDGPPGVSGFIPVDDIEALLDVVTAFADVESDGDNSYTIQLDNGLAINVKEKGGYAFFASRPDLLDGLPAEPEKMLGDKPSKYNLALSINPQEVPQSLRDQALDTIKEGSMQTLNQLDEELKDIQRQNLEAQMRQFEMLLNDSKSLMIGMTADAENKKLYTDFEFVAQADSELAKKTNESKPTKPTRFSGFLMQNAALNFNANGVVPASDGEMYAKLLADGKVAVVDRLNEEGDLSDDEFEKIEVLIDSFTEVLGQTLKQGVVDTGMATVLDDSEANLFGGIAVADPTKVESAVKDLVPLLKERLADLDSVDVPTVTFNLDKETHEGVRFHEIQVSIDEPKAREMIGPSVGIMVGFGPDSVYYGIGNDPLPMIKKAMAAKEKTEFSSEMNLHLAPFLKFASQSEDVPPQVAMMAEKLSENGGDKIRVYSKHIPNGTFARFEMQDGILSLIKSFYEGAAGGGGGGNEF